MVAPRRRRKRQLSPDAAAIVAWRPRFPTPDMLRSAAALYLTADPFVSGPAGVIEVRRPSDGLPVADLEWRGSTARTVVTDELPAGTYVIASNELGRREGPRPRLHIAPGVLRVSRIDLARRERTAERAIRTRQGRTDLMAERMLVDGEFPTFPPRQEITGWSRKSRSRMRRTVGEIDWSTDLTRARPPAMVTLTYPDDWVTLTPTGRASKRHLQMFKKAFRRAWGVAIRAFWKLEFQRRGAPHYHIFMVPPGGVTKRRSGPYGIIPAGLKFRQWLSLIWAMIIRPADPEEFRKSVAAGTGVDYAEGCRARDPRRIAEYFAKHAAFSAKAYQNIVPVEWRGPGDGPGRFWGYWGLRKATVTIEVPELDAIAFSRLLRRWSYAKRDAFPMDHARYDGGRLVATDHEIRGLAGAQEYTTDVRQRSRKSRTRVRRMTGRLGAGWVAVNNGADFASAIARWLAAVRERCPPITAATEPHPLGNRWRIHRRRSWRLALDQAVS